MKYNLLITLVLTLLTFAAVPAASQAAEVELVPSSRVILYLPFRSL